MDRLMDRHSIINIGHSQSNALVKHYGMYGCIYYTHTYRHTHIAKTLKLTHTVESCQFVGVNFGGLLVILLICGYVISSMRHFSV